MGKHKEPDIDVILVKLSMLLMRHLVLALHPNTEKTKIKAYLDSVQPFFRKLSSLVTADNGFFIEDNLDGLEAVRQLIFMLKTKQSEMLFKTKQDGLSSEYYTYDAFRKIQPHLIFINCMRMGACLHTDMFQTTTTYVDLFNICQKEIITKKESPHIDELLFNNSEQMVFLALNASILQHSRRYGEHFHDEMVIDFNLKAAQTPHKGQTNAEIMQDIYQQVSNGAGLNPTLQQHLTGHDYRPAQPAPGRDEHVLTRGQQYPQMQQQKNEDPCAESIAFEVVRELQGGDSLLYRAMLLNRYNNQHGMQQESLRKASKPDASKSENLLLEITHPNGNIFTVSGTDFFGDRPPYHHISINRPFYSRDDNYYLQEIGLVATGLSIFLMENGNIITVQSGNIKIFDQLTHQITRGIEVPQDESVSCIFLMTNDTITAGGTKNSMNNDRVKIFNQNANGLIPLRVSPYVSNLRQIMQEHHLCRLRANPLPCEPVDSYARYHAENVSRVPDAVLAAAVRGSSQQNRRFNNRR